jgi:aspartyl-tRNA synthetase
MSELKVEQMDGWSRTHRCSELDVGNIDADVTLMGWVASARDHGGVIFVDLRDRWGITQVVFDPVENADVHSAAESFRSEFVIAIRGRVRQRMDGMANPKLATGEIEVICTSAKVLNTAEPPPVPIEGTPANEDSRLKYRYVDLRRADMQRNLALRSKAYQATRSHLHGEDFIEIETPIFVRSTPEGARDFLVPSRMSPGSFYAMPQSPQIYKQLLMVGGYDRYFQIVKCFRDEDLRADRQLEFTQIDIEMSFIEEEDIIGLAERVTRSIFRKTIGYEVDETIPRMNYAEAMSRYGSDKPDTRFGLELVDVTDIAKDSEFKVFRNVVESGGLVSAINVKGCAKFSRGQLDALTPFVAQYGAKGAAWMRVTENGLESNIVKFFPEDVQARLRDVLDTEPGDLIVFVADSAKVVWDALGALRLKFGKDLDLIDSSKFSFLWVVNFPLLEHDDDEDRWIATHHPFTAPIQEHMPHMEEGGDPGAILARAYDLIINGNEIAGGSIRIHQRDVQQKMFSLLGIDEAEADERFGFLLNAFRYGTPPHGGVAFGFDRLIMLIAGASSIRDVIAFPKTNSGASPMDGSPSVVDDKQLRELGIRLRGGLKKDEQKPADE